MVSLVSIMLIMKTINAQEQYVLAAEDRCFDSRAYTTDYEFSPPYDGEIIGVKLQHKSGLVDCNFDVHPNTDGLTYWGCEGESWIFIEMIKHDVTGITYYPTATTDGISGLQPLGCTPDEASWGCSVQYYYISGYDGRTSEYIELRDSTNIKQVSTYDRFSLQYGEGCCDVARPDNAGISCADVYFIYTNIYTDDPTNQPTVIPTSQPTNAPSTLPPTEATTNPSSVPTPSPSYAPTQVPSVTPSEIPTVSTLDPSVAPSLLPSVSPTIHPTLEPTTVEPSGSPSKAPEQSQERPTEEDTTEEPKSNSKDESFETDEDAVSGLAQMISVPMIVVSASVCILICVAVFVVMLVRKKRQKEAAMKAMFGVDSDDVTDVYSDNVQSDANMIGSKARIQQQPQQQTHEPQPQLQLVANNDNYIQNIVVRDVMEFNTKGGDADDKEGGKEPSVNSISNESLFDRDAPSADGTGITFTKLINNEIKGTTSCCTDCGLVKEGKVYEEDQLFYCIDCFKLYEANQ